MGVKSNMNINQHKRMACGSALRQYAAGGLVRAPSNTPTKPESPLTKARRDNGVKGMKKGGGC